MFLVKLKSEEIYQHIKEKAKRQECLTEEELMQLIILPLTEKGADGKRKRIEQAVGLVKSMEEDTQAFLLANLMVVSDKFIDKKFSDEIGRWLKMTKIARSIAEEAKEEQMKEVILRMLIKGVTVDKIAEYTGLTFEEVEIIKKESVAKLNA